MVFCIIMVGIIALPITLMILIFGTNWKIKILGSLLCLLFWFGTSFSLQVAEQRDMKNYNNGTCTVCGNSYEFRGGSRSHNAASYYYSCSGCGHTIETTSIME